MANVWLPTIGSNTVPYPQSGATWKAGPRVVALGPNDKRLMTVGFCAIYECSSGLYAITGGERVLFEGSIDAAMAIAMAINAKGSE